MVTADELLGAPLSAVVCEPFQPGGILVPLATWFLNLVEEVISLPGLRADREGRIQGRGHPKRDAVGWAIPVLWPVKILTLPARGSRPTLKGEVRITLRLLEDVEVPATVMASRTPSLVPQTQRLTPGSKSMSLRQLLYAGSTSPSETSPTAEPALAHQQPGITGSSSFFEDVSVPQLTWLILKNGTSYLAETIRLNQERNVEFVIRSHPDPV